MQYRRRALGAALASSTSSSPLDSSCLLRMLQLGERERERKLERSHPIFSLITPFLSLLYTSFLLLLLALHPTMKLNL